MQKFQERKKILTLTDMAKYNITEKKLKEAAYRNTISAKMMDTLKERILDFLIVQKKYKDPNYSAKQLSIDLDANPRYISAALNVRFNMNYSSLVNKYRIEEAMAILSNRKHDDMRMEDVSAMVGFANRQSFYAAFYKINGMTPREYKLRSKMQRATGKLGNNKEKN